MERKKKLEQQELKVKKPGLDPLLVLLYTHREAYKPNQPINRFKEKRVKGIFLLFLYFLSFFQLLLFLLVNVVVTFLISRLLLLLYSYLMANKDMVFIVPRVICG